MINMPFPVRDLPDFIPPYVPPTSSLSRASANRINSASTRTQEITMSLPGYDETIPLVYGEDRMAGLWLVRPYTHISSGELRFAIAWSWGGEEGIEGVQTIFANGAVLPGGVTVRHYYGTAEQEADPTLSADIPGFGDAYKYLAYTVFRVPPATIVGFPQTHQIEAVVRGIRVRDLRLPDSPPVFARYWGIRVTATPRDGTGTYPRFYLAEFDMRESRGGSTATGSGSPGATAGLDVANLFDGNPSTYYNSGTGNNVPIVIYYDFGEEIRIQEIMLAVRNSSFNATATPTDVEFVYSDDGITWNIANTFSGMSWTIGQQRTFDVNQSGSIVFSENPALCMADFISRPEQIGGVGKDVFGVEECADRCDQILGGEVRCELGLTIKQADYLDAMLDMFSAYAEVLWSYEEGGVLMVPDAPVEEPAYVFDYNDIKNLQLLGNEMTQSPTSVTVNIRIATGTEESWPQYPAVQYLPGVQENEIEDVPSDLFMPGIHRISEGLRKALMRLRRLSYPSRFAFQTFDEGVQFQRGDVVQLPDELGLNTRLVRILSIEQIAPGRYQHTAEHYSPEMYPDDYNPGETSSWPVGTGIFFVGAEIPAGWERNTDADGWLLFGASDTYPAGSTTGSTTITVSGTTSANGGHTGEPDNSGGNAWILGTTAGSGVPNKMGEEPDHDHTYSQVSAATRMPYYRREVVIVKVDAPGDIPTDGQVIANGSIISATMSEVALHLGRLVAAGESESGGQSSPFLVSLNYSAEPDHNHDGATTDSNATSPTFGPESFAHVAAGGHTHTGGVDVTLNHKRRRMAVYQASAASPAQVGMVAMYFGDVGDLAGTGFYVCDGNNGTVDLEDFFIERSTSAVAGTAVGDHTCTWNSVTNTVPNHTHKGSSQGNLTAKFGYHLVPTGGHNHVVAGSSAYRPPGYAVTFIQYTGVI